MLHTRIAIVDWRIVVLTHRWLGCEVLLLLLQEIGPERMVYALITKGVMVFLKKQITTCIDVSM